MKKIILALAVVSVVCILTSCDTKVCACYEYTTTGIHPTDIYVGEETACASQSSGREGSVGSRVCVEDHERLTDQQIRDMGQSYKK